MRHILENKKVFFINFFVAFILPYFFLNMVDYRLLGHSFLDMYFYVTCAPIFWVVGQLVFIIRNEMIIFLACMAVRLYLFYYMLFKQVTGGGRLRYYLYQLSLSVFGAFLGVFTSIVVVQ